MVAPASIPFRCEECGRPFAPLEGAACTRCERLLCARHFSRLGTIGVRLGSSPPVCRGCREKQPPSPAAGADA